MSGGTVNGGAGERKRVEPGSLGGEPARASATDALLDRIKLDFQLYREPRADQRFRTDRLTDRARELAQSMALICPASRELSTALTALEESLAWAQKAIMRNEPGGEDG